MRMLRWSLLTLALFAAAPLQAELVEYYVGRDNRTTPFNSPAAPNGDGLPYSSNPNFNRLTLLYAHPNEMNPASNHYHGIGAYTYSGPSVAAVLNDTNSNNRLPEVSTGQPPLELSAGDGLYAGKLVSKAQAGVHYSDLRIRSVDSLSGFAAGTPEHYMFHSSADRWSQSLAGANVLLELVSITPGLNVGSISETNIFPGGIGGTYDLGPGAAIDFTPVFWTDGAAALGNYSAEFRLQDSAGTDFGDSGRFHLDFQVVPEPSTLLLISCGLFVGLIDVGRKRLRTDC